MKHKFFILGLFILFSIPTLAQKHYSLSGLIKDSATGAPVKDATITVGDYLIGTISNEDGTFNFFLQDAIYSIVIEKEGYEKQTIEVELKGDTETKVFINHAKKVDDKKVFRLFAKWHNQETQQVLSTL